jgi:hypothetical protein
MHFCLGEFRVIHPKFCHAKMTLIHAFHALCAAVNEFGDTIKISQEAKTDEN